MGFNILDSLLALVLTCQAAHLWKTGGKWTKAYCVVAIPIFILWGITTWWYD